MLSKRWRREANIGFCQGRVYSWEMPLGKSDAERNGQWKKEIWGKGSERMVLGSEGGNPVHRVQTYRVTGGLYLCVSRFTFIYV